MRIVPPVAAGPQPHPARGRVAAHGDFRVHTPPSGRLIASDLRRVRTGRFAPETAPTETAVRRPGRFSGAPPAARPLQGLIERRPETHARSARHLTHHRTFFRPLVSIVSSQSN